MGQLPDENTYVITKGPVLCVEWYYTAEGAMPARTYYNQMEKKKQVRLYQYAMQMVSQYPQRHLPKTMFNHEDQEHSIYAFKPDDQRFFCFFGPNGRLVITNAYEKNSNKMTKKDREILKIAIRYQEDYNERNTRRTYYE